MSTIEYFKDRFNRMLHGGAWHGDSVQDLLQGLTAVQAASYPVDGAHSIWEIVHHMTCWHEVVIRRLKGEDYEPDESVNWKPITGKTEADWEAAKDALYHSGREVILQLESSPGRDLQQTVPGKPYTIAFMLDGLIEHDAYHGGQIAMLKKLC